MKPTAVLLMIMMLAFAGCGQKEKAADRTTAPTLEEVRNATYLGVAEQDPVTLKDGLWEGEPYAEGGASRPRVQLVRDFLLLGDLDGDGLEEAGVLLAGHSGGTGENIYLAVVGIRGGALRNLDTVLVGDRVQIRKASILDGRLLLELLRAGPEDAMCCPGELAMVGWTLKGNELVPVEAAGPPVRLTLEALAGTEWVLRWWNLDEKAPDEPEVTLFFKDGRMGGSSGCNNYFAAANLGQAPGELEMGPTGGTKKMCEDRIMAVEQRYLAQMDGVTKFGFLTGMLALTYELNGQTGVMLFEGREAP